MATRRATYPASLNLSARRVGLVALATLIVFGSGLAVGLRSGNGGQQGGEAATPSATARYPDPGPTRVVNGVGVGYAHSEAGALAAASEFLSVGGGSLASDQDAYLSAMEERPPRSGVPVDASGVATRSPSSSSATAQMPTV